MEIKQDDKTIYYFLVTVNIIKNGQHEIIEKHGIKSTQSSPTHAYNRLKDNIKAFRKINYPGDTNAITVVNYDVISKDQYETILPYLKH